MFKKILFKIFLIFIFITVQSSTSLSSTITACYDVNVFFLRVGESCITYKIDNKILKINSYMRTVNIGTLAKRIYDYGSSELVIEKISPKKFTFYQEEGTFKRYQEYNFKENKIYVIERKYKKLTDDIEKEERKIYSRSDELDPYSAALFLFKNFQISPEGVIPIFYDDKFYKIPWKTLGEIFIKTPLGEVKVQKLLIKPYIKGKGLLQPKGDWLLYIDKTSLLPIRMEIGFIIGSVKVDLVSINGDLNLIPNLKI